jgi:hypothetical protein
LILLTNFHAIVASESQVSLDGGRRQAKKRRGGPVP